MGGLMDDQVRRVGSMKYEVIGLDLSLTSIGVADNTGTYILSSKLKGEPRLSELLGKVRQAVASVRADVKMVVLENYAFAKRGSYAHAQGELGGVVKLWLYDTHVPYALVTPGQRAKFATGRGNAGKSEVVSAVTARTGIVFSGSGADDECDAWVLREMGLHSLGMGQFDWPAKNMEALEKTEWPLEM